MDDDNDGKVDEESCSGKIPTGPFSRHDTESPLVASIPTTPEVKIITPPPTPDYEEPSQPLNEICGNGIDDDNDGVVDEQDCIPEPETQPTSPPSPEPTLPPVADIPTEPEVDVTK